MRPMRIVIGILLVVMAATEYRQMYPIGSLAKAAVDLQATALLIAGACLIATAFDGLGK